MEITFLSICRVEDQAEDTSTIYTDFSSQFLDQVDEFSIASKTSQHSTKNDELKGDTHKSIFFRIWFNLSKREFVKIAIGSFGAACAGISKPIFGFFIITIGVAYYQDDPKHKIGMYSILFSSIGFLALFAHTMQHYLFGVVGEKAMLNFRQALYSGNIPQRISILCI